MRRAWVGQYFTANVGCRPLTVGRRLDEDPGLFPFGNRKQRRGLDFAHPMALTQVGVQLDVPAHQLLPPTSRRWYLTAQGWANWITILELSFR